MSEMVAFRQGTSMPSRETILHYVVETVSQITELEPALHLLPWSGVNSAIYEQRFAQCYDEGLCAAQTSAPNVPQGILPSTDWAQGIGLLCFAAGYMSAGERPLTHNQLCDFVKQAAVGLSPIEEEAASGFSTVRSIALPVFRRLQRDGHASRILLLQRCCIWLPGKAHRSMRVNRRNDCSGWAAFWGKGASLAYWHSIRRCVKRPSGRKVSPLC
ncbi:membrane protein [Salmonella enterica subsp. enterica]|uniref:2-(5''-triphosphoribosyl)-3'-dephosphocoenzyme-A synthase n=1 Tax=Salmonella enterica I TaxID=59201 RepID=A0A379W2I8_SALET|nr:membrane protein [Salmonella enterica subsp. enterica]